MAAPRSSETLPTDVPRGRSGPGRHARGTWTPQVVAGSGGRRHLAVDEPAAPATTVVTAAGEPVTAAATRPTAPPPSSCEATVVVTSSSRRRRGPIRYAPVPGAPRRSSPAMWGPPRPTWV